MSITFRTSNSTVNLELQLSTPGTITLTNAMYGGLSTITVPDNNLNSYSIDVTNTSLDVTLTGLTQLENLNCFQNSITTLTLTGLSQLLILDCSENSLTTLSLAGLTQLEELTCSRNALTSLNLSPVTQLTSLDCDENSLTSLDLSPVTLLTSLGCYQNSLTSLDLSPVRQLVILDCSSNFITSLDLSPVTQLTNLDISGAVGGRNDITSLDLSPVTRLQYLIFNQTPITTLDLTPVTQLLSISCYNAGSLLNLDVSSLRFLNEVVCPGIPLDQDKVDFILRSLNSLNGTITFQIAPSTIPFYKNINTTWTVIGLEDPPTPSTPVKIKTFKADSSDYTRFKKLQAEQNDLIVVDKNKFRSVLPYTNSPIAKNYINGYYLEIKHNVFGSQAYSANKPKGFFIK